MVLSFSTTLWASHFTHLRARLIPFFALSAAYIPTLQVRDCLAILIQHLTTSRPELYASYLAEELV